MINIVICGDHKFVMPIGVLIYSACVNNKKGRLRFFLIIDESMTDDDKEKLQNVVEDFDDHIYFVQVNADEIRKRMYFKDGFYKIQTFYRLLMAGLLPKDIDKVIYLDGDIIVRKSLETLWSINIEDVALGAVQDAQEGRISMFNRLHYSSLLGYFNAGVLYVNLKYWRSHRLEDQFLEFVNKYPERIVLNDQDILNYVCRNCKRDIPLKYNVQSDFLLKFDKLYFDIWKHYDELLEARCNPVILHYSGCRPWEKDTNHPYKDEFYAYLNETSWKGSPLWPNRTTWLMKLVNRNRWWLSKLHLVHYLEDPFDRTLQLTD